MELSTFISESLKSIITGVKEAKDFALKNGAIINPSVENPQSRGSIQFHYIRDIEGAKYVNDIDFDIALTVSNQQNSDIGGKINVYALAIGSTTNETEINKTVSRLKFSVKAILPSTDTSAVDFKFKE